MMSAIIISFPRNHSIKPTRKTGGKHSYSKLGNPTQHIATKETVSVKDGDNISQYPSCINIELSVKLTLEKSDEK